MSNAVANRFAGDAVKVQGIGFGQLRVGHVRRLLPDQRHAHGVQPLFHLVADLGTEGGTKVVLRVPIPPSEGSPATEVQAMIAS